MEGSHSQDQDGSFKSRRDSVLGKHAYKKGEK